jgi:hypothetical protein
LDNPVQYESLIAVVGNARHKLEKRLRRPVVSNKNYLKEPENRGLLKKKD